MARKLSIGLITLALCLGFASLTRGFYPYKVLFDFPFHAEWETPLPANLPLNGPFFYLGHGLQSYVFEDASKTYVIKLFRSDLRKQRSSLERSEKLLRTLNASKLAYDILPEETGLLGIHLNTTMNVLGSATFYDRLGIPRTISLDQLRFVVQKKAIPFREAFSKGEVPKLINGFLQLLDRRIALGIHNSDRNLCSNFGFIGSQAIEIDCGNYVDYRAVRSEKWKSDEKLRFIAALHKWVAHHAPEYVHLLEKN